MSRSPALLLCAALLGLSCTREGDENLGVQEQPPPQAVGRRDLQRISGLLKVAAVHPGEAVRRLGSHRFEARTSWQITPPPRDGVDVYPAVMQEESLVEADGQGGLHILHNNDHGYGSEAVLVGGQLYLRMRHQPYVRRRPEGDEVQRLLGAAADTGGALLLALGPWIKIDEVAEATVAGRPAFRLTLSRQPGPQKEGLKQFQGALPPGKFWRKLVSVLSLSGAAVVDAAEGVLLGLRLQASFQAPRGEGGPLVQVEVNHRATFGSLGETVAVAAPEGALEQPVRPRPMLDHQELLEGLVPRPSAR